MAKAIRVPELPKEDTRDVQLNMTAKEAHSLLLMLSRVNGHDGEGGVRDDLNSIYYTLESAGINYDPSSKVFGERYLTVQRP